MHSDNEIGHPSPQSASRPSRVLESIESFVGVANEWQTHFRILIAWESLGLSMMSSSIVFLWNLIDGEIADIYLRRKLRLERSSNTTKLVPNDTLEEGMFLDLRGTIMRTPLSSKPIIGVTKETVKSVSSSTQSSE
jgi:hypothetical protein